MLLFMTAERLKDRSVGKAWFATGKFCVGAIGSNSKKNGTRADEEWAIADEPSLPRTSWDGARTVSRWLVNRAKQMPCVPMSAHILSLHSCPK